MRCRLPSLPLSPEGEFHPAWVDPFRELKGKRRKLITRNFKLDLTLVFVIGLMITFKLGFCQNIPGDTSYTLPDVQISALKVEQFSSGQKIREIDSLSFLLNQGANLGEILSRNSAIQFKNYNYNGLNLISFRGTSAHHTGVYWNGFQINPSTTSQVDFALIPSNMFNDISILYGGSSTLLGSGNIGGSILLNNNPFFHKSQLANIGLAMGSFGEYHANGIFEITNNKWYTKTALIYKSAKNNFKYKSLKGEEKEQKNAAFNQIGLMQDIYRSFGKHGILGISWWYQENEREIPATLTSKPSDAWQDDKSLRASISYKQYFNKGQLNLKSAYLEDYLHYQDPDTIPDYTIDSEITSFKSISEADFEYEVMDWFVVNLGSNFSYEEGMSGYYSNTAYQRHYAIYTSGLFKIPKINWNLNLNLRQDFYNEFKSPFLYAVGFEGKFWKWFSGKINASRNFRIPTFHDLYWEPGGNPDLQPEESKNIETSLIAAGGKKVNFEFIFTAYGSKVENWILWVPDGLFWSPQNVQEVWSRGFEVSGSTSFQIVKVKTRINGGYTFARSTNEIKQGPNDDSYQKQLLYVPEHNYYFNISIAYRGLVLNYNQSYTGLRYTTLDNEEYLPAYTLGNLSLRKDFSIRSHRLGIQFDINNIWNKEYQAVLYYPTPGRSYKITINFLINNSKQQ